MVVVVELHNHTHWKFWSVKEGLRNQKSNDDAPRELPPQIRFSGDHTKQPEPFMGDMWKRHHSRGKTFFYVWLTC